MNAIPIREFITTEEDLAEIAREAAHEEAREWALDEFDEWRGRDWRNREFACFSAFLIEHSQPHMIDSERYAAALGYGERVR